MKATRSGWYVCTVCVIMVAEYIFHMGFDLLPWLSPHITYQGIIAAIWFHLIFLLVLTSYIQCVRTEPGRIPPNWAFHAGDGSKRKRYCRECNIWKPDRAHHCSVCRKCVLNMDHHCPWINNCVGFYNRKFFLQLLFYGLIGLATVFIHSLSQVVYMLWTQEFSPPIKFGELGIAILMTSITGCFFVALSQFFAFHWRLVTSNLTTIENLDAVSRLAARYDLGRSRNLAQVMGKTPTLWWLPAHIYPSRPDGDGVRWPLSDAAMLAAQRLC